MTIRPLGGYIGPNDDIVRWAFGGPHFVIYPDLLSRHQLKIRRGEWVARETERLAGNIDWTGEDGTRISWYGGESRYYNDSSNTATISGTAIFSDGQLLAVAPARVYGAAIRGPWLLAVCLTPSPAPHPWTVFYRLLSELDDDWAIALEFSVDTPPASTSLVRVPWHFDAAADTAMWIDWRLAPPGDVWTLTIIGGSSANEPPVASVAGDIGAQETETVTPATNDPPLNFMPPGDNAAIQFCASTRAGAIATGSYSTSDLFETGIGGDSAHWRRTRSESYSGEAAITVTIGPHEFTATAIYSATLETLHDQPSSGPQSLDYEHIESLSISATLPWDASPIVIHSVTRSATFSGDPFAGGAEYSYSREVVAVVPQWFSHSDDEDHWSRLVTTVTETFIDGIPVTDFGGDRVGTLLATPAAALEYDVERSDRLVLPADDSDTTTPVEYTETGVATGFLSIFDWRASDQNEEFTDSGTEFAIPALIPGNVALNESRFAAATITPGGAATSDYPAAYDAIHGTPKSIAFQWTNAADAAGAGERRADHLFAVEPGLSGVYRITERGATDDDIGIDERRTYELVDSGGVYVRRTRVIDRTDESRILREDHSALINDTQLWTDYAHSGDAGLIRTIVDNVASNGTITGISNTTDGGSAESGIKTTRERWRYLFADLRYDAIVQAIFAPGVGERIVITFSGVDVEEFGFIGFNGDEPRWRVRPDVQGNAAARPIGTDVWLCGNWEITPSYTIGALWSAQSSTTLDSLIPVDTHYPIGVL